MAMLGPRVSRLLFRVCWCVRPQRTGQCETANGASTSFAPPRPRQYSTHAAGTWGGGQHAPRTSRALFLGCICPTISRVVHTVRVRHCYRRGIRLGASQLGLITGPRRRDRGCRTPPAARRRRGGSGGEATTSSFAEVGRLSRGGQGDPGGGRWGEGVGGVVGLAWSECCCRSVCHI